MKTLFPALAMALCLNSCAHFFVKEKTYVTEGEAQVNGAQVTSAVKGMGGKAGMNPQQCYFLFFAADCNVAIATTV